MIDTAVTDRRVYLSPNRPNKMNPVICCIFYFPIFILFAIERPISPTNTWILVVMAILQSATIEHKQNKIKYQLFEQVEYR